MSDEIQGAIVGGIIGLLGASIPIYWSWVMSRFDSASRTHDSYLAWLRGLVPELEHLSNCIATLKTEYDHMIAGGELICPTKELNTDYLAQARVGITSHPRAGMLFPALTEAFRDCVHTNDMMRRYEREYQQAMRSPNPRIRLSGILRPTSESCKGVLSSVNTALNLANDQMNIESDYPPKMCQFIRFPLWPCE